MKSRSVGRARSSQACWGGFIDLSYFIVVIKFMFNTIRKEALCRNDSQLEVRCRMLPGGLRGRATQFWSHCIDASRLGSLYAIPPVCLQHHTNFTSQIVNTDSSRSYSIPFSSLFNPSFQRHDTTQDSKTPDKIRKSRHHMPCNPRPFFRTCSLKKRILRNVLAMQILKECSLS